MSQISTDLYKELLDRMSDGVYFVDCNRQILYWNEGAARLTGYTSEEIVGKHCPDNILCHVDGSGRQLCADGCPLLGCIQDGEQREAEVFLRHKQGRRVPVSVQVQPIREADGSVVGAVEIFRDNTAEIEVRRKAEVMERLAFLDSLTHLPNRRFMAMSLETALVEYNATNEPFGVLAFDVNQFKAINDSFGHASGDRALVEVAETLTGALRGADIVGRWGGDEFLAIARSVSMEVLGELAERCEMLIGETFFRDGNGAMERLSMAVGVALVKPGDDVDSLVARADHGMYASKKASAKVRGAANGGLGAKGA
ncbi:MAG: sensor domain-containing diguanylate cyclase [Acidobacteriota bacterium]|nr:sensor domain-containing diguanylate cyclase [Acidobacteriota bacterium]